MFLKFEVGWSSDHAIGNDVEVGILYIYIYMYKGGGGGRRKEIMV